MSNMPPRTINSNHNDPSARPWNDGTLWSDADIDDLMGELASGESIDEIAMYLERTESDVREKVKELGLER
jgi:hypothetical protein